MKMIPLVTCYVENSSEVDNQHVAYILHITSVNSQYRGIGPLFLTWVHFNTTMDK